MEMEESERKDNLERQDKEAEALSAIYGDDFRRVGDGSAWDAGRSSYIPRGVVGGSGRSSGVTTVRMVLLETYPSQTPPLIELDASGETSGEDLPFGRHELAVGMVDELYRDSPHEVMLFGYVEWLRGRLLEQWREEDAEQYNGGGGDYGGGGEEEGEEGDEGGGGVCT